MPRSRVSHFVFAAVAAAGMLCAGAALASQGPGAGPGAAGRFTQLAMASFTERWGWWSAPD
jgi:hypothetical protein